jgi:hypothetical protein
VYFEYRRTNADKQAEYNKRHRTQWMEWYNRRREEDPTYKLSTNLRASLHHGLKRGHVSKTCSAGKLLGIDCSEFKRWLEFQFEP